MFEVLLYAIQLICKLVFAGIALLFAYFLFTANYRPRGESGIASMSLATRRKLAHVFWIALAIHTVIFVTTRDWS